MAEQMSAAEEIKTLGRDGFKIPEVHIDQIVPKKFIDFFHGIWTMNGVFYESFFGDEPSLRGLSVPRHHLVVPAGNGKPLVLLEYSHAPAERRYWSPTENIGVLVPPQQTGKFDPLIGITYRADNSETVGGRSHFTVDFDDSNTEFTVFHENDEFYEYGESDKNNWSVLREAISQVIELTT